MSQKIFCDGCGATDDWVVDGTAFFPDGGRLLVRDGKGADEGFTVDLCGECLDKIYDALPKLKEIQDG